MKVDKDIKNRDKTSVLIFYHEIGLKILNFFLSEKLFKSSKKES